MGTTYAPDGYALAVGSWGTDADQETTTIYTGNYSVVLKNTAVATALQSTADAHPTAPGEVWLADFIVRADSVAAGNTVALNINWLNAAKAYLSSTAIYSAAVLPAANTWYEISGTATAPASAYFAYVGAVKAATAFNVYIDTMGIKKSRPSFYAYKAASQNISTATATKVLFDTEEHDNGNIFDAVTNNRFDVQAAGLYAIMAQVSFSDSMADQTYGYLAIYVNGGIEWSTRFWCSGSNDPTPTLSIPATTLARGDYVEVYIYQASGDTKAIAGGDRGSYFSATKLD